MAGLHLNLFSKSFKGFRTLVSLFTLIFLLLTSLILTGCPSAQEKNLNPDEDISLGDGGDFNPVDDVTEIDPGDEDCENFDAVSISPNWKSRPGWLSF